MTLLPTGSQVVISGGGRRFHRIEECYYFQIGRQKVKNRKGVLAEIQVVAEQDAVRQERFPCEWCVVRGLGATRSIDDGGEVSRHVGAYAKLDERLERVVQERSLGKDFDDAYGKIERRRQWTQLKVAVENSSDAIRYWMLGFTASMAERWTENDFGLWFAVELADAYGMTGQLINRWLNGGARAEQLPNRRPRS